MWSFALQRLFPMDASDRMMSRGLWFDSIWFSGELARQLTWIPLYFVFLIWIKRNLLGNFELIAPGTMPRAMLLIVAYWPVIFSPT